MIRASVRRHWPAVCFLCWTAASWASEPIPIRSLPGAKADAAALLFSGSDGGALWSAVAALPRAEGDGVDLTIQVDAETLVAAHGELAETLRLETYVYALSDGKLVDSFAGRMRLASADLDGSAGVQWSLRLSLEPGSYDLRVLVRDRGSQAFSLRRIPFESGPGSTPVRWPSVGDWLEARSTEESRVGGIFSPWPVLAVGREEALMEDVGGDLALFDAQGARPAGCKTRVETRGFRVTGDASCAGSYGLGVSEGGWKLPVLLLPSEWRDQRLTWAQVRRLLEQPEDQQRILEAGRDKRRSGRVKAWVAAYSKVLESLAQGQSRQAVEALMDFDRQAFDSGKTSLAVLEDVKASIRRVGKELAGEAPESLFPVLWLHLELHDAYARLGIDDSFVFEATWTRIRQLAPLYADKADTEVARRLASTLLAELGIAVDRRGLPRTALRLFGEATEMDPANQEVWRYLAFWHERRGQVDKAVEALEQLLALAPELHESRLRLAIGLRRLDRGERALELLEDVLRRGRDPRALVVAYQEAGRLLFELGRVDEAVDRVSAGVERFPNNQRLRLQLGHLLERNPSRTASDRQRVSDLLDELPKDSGPSARHVYQKPPAQASGKARAELTRHANARLPVLSASLPALKAAGGES